MFNNIKSTIESIIKWLRPDRVDAFTDARYTTINRDVQEMLRWSNAKGVLLQVNVAKSNANPDYKYMLDDQPVILGPGSSLVDAAASAPDMMTNGTPPGYTYSLDDSYYVWATPKGGSVQYHPQFAEGTRVINAAIRDELARRTVDASIRRRANRDIVDGMLRHYEALQQGAAARQKARALHDSFAALQSRLDQIDAALKRELDHQAKLQQASQFVDRLSAVLQFASVMSSTLSTIDNSDRPGVQNAKTPEELKKALANALTDAAKEVESAKAVQVQTRTEFKVQQQNIHVLLDNGGAPKVLTISTLTVQP